MSLLVTGSIGIDTVESPSGKVEDALGGVHVSHGRKPVGKGARNP